MKYGILNTWMKTIIALAQILILTGKIANNNWLTYFASCAVQNCAHKLTKQTELGCMLISENPKTCSRTCWRLRIGLLCRGQLVLLKEVQERRKMGKTRTEEQMTNSLTKRNCICVWTYIYKLIYKKDWKQKANNFMILGLKENSKTLQWETKMTSGRFWP